MSGLLGKKPTQSATPVRYNAIQINQSAYGNCIPLQYGTNRLPITLMDYTDFNSTPASQGAGGKGGPSQTTSSYNYSASWLGLLCEGPSTGAAPAILTVFQNQSETTLGALNLIFFAGTVGQAPWSYMTQNHPDHALSYDHTAYIAAPNFALGSSAGLPNLTFEVQGLLLWGGLADSHPADIIPDYLNDPNHGAGFSYIADLATFRNYCTAMGFFISPSETTQRAAQDFLTEITQITNSNTVWSAATGLRFVPYGDQSVTGNGSTYTPDLTPEYEIFDNNYVKDKNSVATSPVTRSITPANETFNCWRVEFLDRDNQYNTAIAEYRDELDIAVNGLRVNSTISLHSITQRVIAHQVSTLLCNRNLYIRSTFVFKLPMDFSDLEPMDLISINDSTAGIVDQLVRITDIQDDNTDVLTITAEEMMVGPASAPLYNNQLVQAYAQNFLEDPGPVATPYIFTFPPALADPAAAGYEMGIAVGGTSGEWGGCDVWASLDNITYSRLGLLDGPSRYGIVNSPLAKGPADPDTVNTLTVQLNTTTPQTILSGTRADADNLRTPCIVDGEIIAYQTATALGNNEFTLSYLRRGKYGSTNATHAAGTQFAVIDENLFCFKFDPGYCGSPVWFKFPSFNTVGQGQQSLADCTAYQGFFQGQNGGVLEAPGAIPLTARGQCVVVGDSIYKMTSAAAAWDSDAVSQSALSGGLELRFNACQTNAAIMIGLNSDPLTNENFNTLDFSWYAGEDGNAYIYENGALVATVPGGYSTSTLFHIKYDGKYVTYLLDSVTWRTVPAPGKVLYFDCSFFTPGGAVQNVYFGLLNPASSSPFVVRGNCYVSGETFGKKITSNGGALGWSDSDIYSLEGYPTCHLSVKPNDTTGIYMIGLTTTPGVLPINYTNIAYAFELDAGAFLRIFESGTLVTTLGTYSAADVVSIVYDNAFIVYYWNNVAVRSVHAPGQVLFLTGTFYQPGGGCNSVDFGPTPTVRITDTQQLGGNAATSVIVATLAGPFDTRRVPTGVPGADAANIAGAITIGPYTTACDIIVTAQGYIDFKSSTSFSCDCFGQLQNQAEWNVGSGDPSGGTFLVASAAGVETFVSFSLEKHYTLATNTTDTYYFQVLSAWNPANGGFSDFSNVMFKVEVIKR